MLAALQELAIRASRTWWLYLLLVLLFAGSLQALMQIGAAFPPHAGGAAPFDLQNALTPGEVYPQVAGYSPRARELYLAFTLIDYAFPFLAGLFIMATVAFGLRHGLPGVYATVVDRRLLPLPMIAALFDWLENVAAAAAIYLFPTEFAWLPPLLVLAKQCKLALAGLGNGIMGLALLAALARWLATLVRR